MRRFGMLLIALYSNIIYEIKCDELHSKLALETIKGSFQNRAVSPILLRFALCKLASVAKGSSRDELTFVLGIKSNNTLQKCYTSLKQGILPLKDLDVIFLNKIIFNYTDDIEPSFTKNQTDFGVIVDKVGFNYPKLAIAFINRWVDRATYKRITDILEPNDIDNKSSVLIVSAAYFKVTWEFPFDIRNTKSMKFHHHDGNVSLVDMMSKTDTLLYINDDVNNIECCNIKLANFGLSITILVPRSSRSLNELINKIYNDDNVFKMIYQRMRYETVDVMLPRFKIKTNIEWNKYLNKIGIKQIFNETDSGLNVILKNNTKINNIFVSKVKQKVFIDVDEMGIYRQPPREDFVGMEHQEKLSLTQMIADRPFFFIIGFQPNPSNLLTMHEIISGIYYGPGY